jgi:glycosyltransferase involved in cell wall biosynthesis
MFRHATVIFCKTPETQAILPARDRAKSLVQLEIGLEPHRIWQGNTARVANADFLYAGRLLYWKGVHLALKALSELRRERPDATLTVIGTGTDEAKLRKLAVALELRDSVRWLGWVPQEQIWAHYRRYTAFVFPSMHDSSGNVLLEAMSQALPVICLDTGGPGAILPTSCGIKVPVEYQSEAEVVSALSAAMLRIADHPELRVQMGRRALEAARESTWGNVVFNSYAHVEQALAASATHGMNRPNQGKQWRNAL